MAAISGALYPCGLALFLDLLSKVLAIAIDAIPVVALHGEGLQAILILVANLASKSFDCPCLWHFCKGCAQACSIQYLVRLVHIRFDKFFLVPSHVPE